MHGKTHKSTTNLLENDIELFKVYRVDNKIRLGSNIDGGYVIGHLDILYDGYITAGIAGNDDFTVDFLNKYNVNLKDCFAFDGTIEKIPTNLIDKVTFIKKNIGNTNDDKTTNLDALMKSYNNIFVKMDIEGGEWPWLLSMNNAKLNNIAQLVIELHGITDVSWHGITVNSFNCDCAAKTNCLRMLSDTHYLVHAHGNNADLVAKNGLPNVIELVYINKKNFHEIPQLNSTPLPIKGLDFPNEVRCPDVDLNFYPFVNKLVDELEVNPFLIDIPDQAEYTLEDYVNIQNQLNNKNVDNSIDNIIKNLYSTRNKFYSVKNFKSRIEKGITQTLINLDNKMLPTRNLYKIGTGGNNRNCVVCCTPFTDTTNEQGTSRYNASKNIRTSLENTGFNGYFYLFNGGFPNPTGTEMKYAGVPYCFKIFMMLEAQKKGFDKVIWIDSGCYALNNPESLFELLYKDDAVMKTIDSNNNYTAMVFQNTIEMLNRITKCNMRNAIYLETIVFGLNMDSTRVKELIKEYYNMVRLGYPFFSIFPEEIVLSALFQKEEYKGLITSNQLIKGKLQIHEKNMNEEQAKNNGYYFHHKDYSKYKTQCYVTFDNPGGRFGNQLFRYLMCKLFTVRFGHKYISKNMIPDDNFIIVNDKNINDILKNPHTISNKNIVCQGFFQKSELFVDYREQLMKAIFNDSNDDYWRCENKDYYIKDYLLNSKHTIDLKSNTVVVALRLDDFIQYPCKTSDIIPPQYYIDILEKMKITEQPPLYIVCDTLKHNWEFKYIQYFSKWNPIVVQASLQHDIALMRDCPTLIHSNSSLCWIISFLSNKTKRVIPYTPKLYMNHHQSLNKICETDVLNYVTPLNHDEVHHLDVNDVSVLPFSFSIPDECVVEEIPNKTRLLASLIPGDMTTYTFDKYKENEYNIMYREARFAITKMKGGWDCLRHYEILMNGCIPLFEDLKDCPENTLTTYPKEYNDVAYELYNNWGENDECIEKYNILCLKLLDHTRTHCTTSACAKYFLKNIKNGDKVKNILLITGHYGVNYNREMLWIGLKRYIKSINGVAVEWGKMPFLYDDFDNLSEHKYYGNNCYTFPKRIEKDSDYHMSESEIINKIKDNFWDLIIYGKVGPDEFCTFPLYDIVKSHYNKNKIAFIFGGDEIFNLKITDGKICHRNMFNVNIYYKPYADYLNYYKQFGTCFVRELDK
jgi:hypothetical protein